MAETVRGYLVITVMEASGKNKDENYVWDSSSFEGFVKGGYRNDLMIVSKMHHCR